MVALRKLCVNKEEGKIELALTFCCCTFLKERFGSNSKRNL